MNTETQSISRTLRDDPWNIQTDPRAAASTKSTIKFPSPIRNHLQCDHSSRANSAGDYSGQTWAHMENPAMSVIMFFLTESAKCVMAVERFF